MQFVPDDTFPSSSLSASKSQSLDSKQNNQSEQLTQTFTHHDLEHYSIPFVPLFPYVSQKLSALHLACKWQFVAWDYLGKSPLC